MKLKYIYQKVIDLFSNKNFSLNFYVMDSDNRCVIYYQLYSSKLSELNVLDFVVDYSQKEIVFNLKKE